MTKYFSEFGGLWPDGDDFERALASKLTDCMLSPNHASLFRRWRRDGFVVLEDAVDPRAIDVYQRELDAVLVHPDPRLKISIGAKREIVSLDAERFRPGDSVRLVDDYVYNEAARNLLFAPEIVGFLSRLFQDAPLLFQSLWFEFGSQQGMHQDTAYVVATEPMSIVGVWLALEDVQEGSGELEYYAGSHRLPEHKFSGRYKHWSPQRDGEEEHNEWGRAIHENAAKLGLQRERLLAKKGSVLIWHADLAHGGAPITKPEVTRRSLVGHFCPASVAPLYFYQFPQRANQAAWRGGYYASLHYPLPQLEAGRASQSIGAVQAEQKLGIRGAFSLLSRAVQHRVERDIRRLRTLPSRLHEAMGQRKAS